MHLEKVTSRSSDAGLAGWIASNDATLFTTVMVVVIAIFLHSKLNRGAKENLELTGEKATLSASLESTASELEAVSGLLDRTTDKLNLTQEERDQLQQQLVEKLDQIAQLNAKLEVLLEEKGVLESQRQALAEAKASLTEEKAALVKQRAALVENRSALTSANVTLRERLDAISSQLADKIAALAEVEKQRDRLKKQADELDAIVASLKQRLEELNIELVEAKGSAADVRAASETKVQQLQAKLSAGDKKAEEYLVQLKRAATLLESLRLENQKLEVTLTKAEQQRQLELLEEGRHNRELVGLKGPLNRVAILFDASGSMRQAGAGGESDRWAEAQEIAATWLQHLNVQQCVLIVFSSDIRTFPGDGSLADLRGASGKATREALLQQLKAVSPRGRTNTLDALRKAYEYDVDTILLFSDGAPSMADTGAFDAALARRIYELCGQRRSVPINAIGLGNYFDKDMSTFLQTVARITGGAFRGE